MKPNEWTGFIFCLLVLIVVSMYVGAFANTHGKRSGFKDGVEYTNGKMKNKPFYMYSVEDYEKLEGGNEYGEGVEDEKYVFAGVGKNTTKYKAPNRTPVFQGLKATGIYP